LLQALGNRQVERLDRNPAIRLRDRFSPNQQVVELAIDKIAVPLEVLLIDIEPGCYPEESLEFRHDHHMAGGSLVRLRRGDHDRMLPRVGRAPIDGCQVLSNFFSLNFVRGAEN
jgi:hypothetical protein